MKTMDTEATVAPQPNATAPTTKSNISAEDMQLEIEALSAMYGMDCSEEDFSESNSETYFESLAATQTARDKLVRSATDVAHRTTSTQKKDGRSSLMRRTNSFNSAKKDENSLSVFSVSPKGRRLSKGGSASLSMFSLSSKVRGQTKGGKTGDSKNLQNGQGKPRPSSTSAISLRKIEEDKDPNWRSKSLMDEEDLARFMKGINKSNEFFSEEIVSTEPAPETKQALFRRSRSERAFHK